MSVSNGQPQVLVWDDEHVVFVNHQRRELYLYENLGSSPGELRYQEGVMAIRADITDPLKVLDLAIRYALRYELLTRIVGSEMAAVFEQLGVKEFLERIQSLTTEQMRRNRFAGLSFFEFTINQGMNGQTAAEAADDDEDELQDEDEATAEVSPTPSGRGRRRSGSS